MSTRPPRHPAREPAIPADELKRRFGDPDLTVVDVRPLAAYNGWSLHGEARGGHIPGAVAFPATWLSSLDDDEINRLLRAKGVGRGRTVVVYGDGPDDPAELAARLRAAGLDDVRIFEAGWKAWASDPHLPLERLPLCDRLVHVDWLREVLAGRRPEAAPTDRHLIFHVNCGAPEEYEEGHIPGALYLDTNELEDPVDWNRRSPAALDDALRALGITARTTVILYGRDAEDQGHADENGPGRRVGQLAATRAALILRYAGVDDVRLLDGGYDCWVRAGNPVDAQARAPMPVRSFGMAIPLRPELIVDIAGAKQILADGNGAALVSVRTWREHIGAASGYDYIGAAGRIKGDVWGNRGADAYHGRPYRTVDNTMRAYPEITANWQLAGITPDKLVAFYCGTGWRASEAWFYAYLQDWPRIAVYDGGWFEWSRDPVNNPIEVGEPGDGFAG